MSNSATPGEFKDIASISRTLVPDGEWLPGPAKWSLWTNEKHGKAWHALTNATAIGKLDPAVVVLVRDQSVQLTWGGTLIGHWGVVLRETDQQGRQGRDPWASNPGRRELRDVIAPGISVFSEPD